MRAAQCALNASAQTRRRARAPLGASRRQQSLTSIAPRNACVNMHCMAKPKRTRTHHLAHGTTGRARTRTLGTATINTIMVADAAVCLRTCAQCARSSMRTWLGRARLRTLRAALARELHMRDRRGGSAWRTARSVRLHVGRCRRCLAAGHSSRCTGAERQLGKWRLARLHALGHVAFYLCTCQLRTRSQLCARNMRARNMRVCARRVCANASRRTWRTYRRNVDCMQQQRQQRRRGRVHAWPC